MLVYTASEGESDESVVSAESEKSEKWGEKRGLVVVSRLTGIGFPPQLRALHENFKKTIRNFYEEFYIEFMNNFIKNLLYPQEESIILIKPPI